ncbi:MAG TPA: GYF domain-containing protein, partial [Polyangiaceae bacterium]|nr:GYF domain-containing protein [Polyangiaceae bacterium]
MRVTCDGCGAKYAIADERLQGRSVRVKCKKCGASIAVEALGGAAEAEAEPAFTVLLDDGEQRPVTAEQLGELYRQGAVHADTYLWKEGMDDWRPLSEVEEAKRLADAPLDQGVEVTAVPIAETPAAGPAVERARRAVASSPNVDLFGEGALPPKSTSTPGPGRAEAGPPRAGSPMSSRAGSALRVEASPLSSRAAALAARAEAEALPVSSRSAPLSARGSGAEAGPFSSSRGAGPASASGGDNLFGPPSSAASPGSAGRAEPADDRLNASLSGSRNEQSVLFSVANLGGGAKNGAEPAKKLSFADAPAAPASATTSSDSEASGMIDMRILSTMQGGPSKPKEAPREDRVDDLMGMGGMSAPMFGPTFAAPLLAPPSLDAPPPPPPPVAEAMPTSEGTARDAEAPVAVATAAAATTAGAPRSKLPKWAPFAAAGVLGLGVLGVLGLSGVMSPGPDKGKDAPAAVAAKGDEASPRAQ